MNLTLESLEEVGAFTGAPIEKTITWKQGKKKITATVYVRPLSYKSAVADITAVSKNTDAVAGRIAASICDDKGAPVFKPEDVTGESKPERGPLNRNLTMALLGVIAEVNGLGKTDS